MERKAMIVMTVGLGEWVVLPAVSLRVLAMTGIPLLLLAK